MINQFTNTNDEEMVTMPDGTVIPKAWAEGAGVNNPLTDDDDLKIKQVEPKPKLKQKDKDKLVRIKFSDNRDSTMIDVSIPSHMVPLVQSDTREGLEYKEHLSSVYRQHHKLKGGTVGFPLQKKAKGYDDGDSLLTDLPDVFDSRLDKEKVFGKNISQKQADEFNLFDRVNARFWENFLPFGYESDVPFSQDENWTADRIGEIVGGMAGFGLSFAGEMAVLGGTSLPVTSVARMAKLNRLRKLAKRGHQLVDAGKKKQGKKLIEKASKGFSDFTLELAEKKQLAAGPRGILGMSEKYNDMLIKVASGQKIGGKLSFKGNPKIANAMDMGIRNMIGFQAHGQLHTKALTSMEDRLSIAKHEAINSVLFTGLGAPKFWLKGGKKQAWDWIAEPAGIFAIGYGWDDKDPQGNPLSMEDRLISGFGMVAFHGAMMGMNRIQIKEKMRNVMINHLGYSPEKATKVIKENVGWESIINFGVSNASKVQGEVNYWSKSKGKNNKDTINISSIVKPTTSDGKWRMTYNFVNNPNKQHKIEGKNQNELYSALRKKGYKPVNIRANKRLMPPSEPSKRMTDKVKNIKKNISTLKNIKERDKYFEENEVIVRGKKVESSRLFDPSKDIIPVRNDAGKIVAYELKTRVRKTTGTHSPVELNRNNRLRFRTKKQLMEFVNKNWLPKNAINEQINYLQGERRKVNTASEYNQWKQLIGLAKKNAGKGNISEKEFSTITKQLYPQSGGKLENLNRWELAHLSSIVNFNKNMVRYSPPPDHDNWYTKSRDVVKGFLGDLTIPVHTRLLFSDSKSAHSLGRKMLKYELERQQIASEGIKLKKVLEDQLGIKGDDFDNILSVIDDKFKDWDTGNLSGSRKEINIAKQKFTDDMYSFLVSAGVEVNNLSRGGKRWDPIFAIYDKAGQPLHIFDPKDSIRLMGGHKYTIQEDVLNKNGDVTYVYRNEGRQFFDTKKEAHDWAKKHHIPKEAVHYTTKYKDPSTGEIRKGYEYRGDVAKIYNIKKSRDKNLDNNQYANYRAETQKKPDRILREWETDVRDSNGNLRQNVSVYNGKWRTDPVSKKKKMGRGAQGHYIPDFFTRQLSESARKALATDNSFRARVVENIKTSDKDLKDLSLKNLKGIPRGIKNDIQLLKKVNKAEAQEVLDNFIHNVALTKFKKMANWAEGKGVYGTQYVRQADLDPQFVYGKNDVMIKNVKEFNIKVGDRIDNITGLKTNKKRGSTKVEKVIDTYERNFGKLLARYSEQVAHIVPSYRHYGRGGADNPSISIQRDKSKVVKEIPLEQKIASETNEAFAKWAINAVRRQDNGWDPLEAYGLNFGKGFTAISKVTSNLGLSSPLSGWKNLLLGQAENFTTFGAKTFIEGLGTGMNDSKFWHDYNLAIGGRYAGSYELGTKGGAWSAIGATGLMSPTEVWNRHFAVAMGRIAARKAFNTLRTGEKGILDFGKKSSYNVMKDVFKFSDKEISTMLKRGKMTTKEEVQAAQMAHIITQGAPTLPFIPVWMSRPWVKPLTIFYRIGYRMTDNIYNNVLKPLVRDNNPAPLARYAVSRALAGEGVYWGIHQALGEDRRNQYKSMSGRLMDNMFKAEFFGVFTNMVDEDGSSSGLLSEYEPAPLSMADNVIGNILLGGKWTVGEIKRWLKSEEYNTAGGKTLAQMGKDIIQENYVFGNHLIKNLHRMNKSWWDDDRWKNRYLKNYQKAVEDVIKEEGPYKAGVVGKVYDKDSYIGELGAVAPYYRHLKELFVNDESSIKELADSYYATAHLVFAQELLDEMANSGPSIKDKEQAVTRAKLLTEEKLKTVIKRMRPIPESWHNAKTGESKYYKFAQSMATDEDRERLKAMLDKYDKVFVPRLNKAIRKFSTIPSHSPWSHITFKSFGTTAKDLKALRPGLKGLSD